MFNLENNKKLNSKYKLLTQIGKGGMSVIYLAIKKDDNSKWAIKVMKSEQLDKTGITRFKEEIRISNKVNSPYVIKIDDYCFDPGNNEFWIAMEFVDGTILKNVIERVGSLTENETVNYAKQIVLGIDAIHKAGIYHRDIKDTNIMVSNLNEIKIIDLGIAIDEDSERVTKENNVIGSVHYMAGEIAEYKKKGSPKADIYAIGIVIYQMLIGNVPFTGDTYIKILAKHRESEIPNIKNMKPNTSNGLINVINKCLAKDPNNRYDNMEELYRDLSTCLDPKRMAENELVYKRKVKKGIADFLASKAGMITIWTIFGITLLLLIIVIILLYGIGI
ncbi:serine/threonine-protein kinase [Mesomycoplasma lagogenitalium]|uniref:Serine/threonine-protein kinase n=1 Tax=Mesomycoplasma lagogenitalium TaxID=171286 RepID=A0ABY8LVT6_9BACT|nr:serine/threonine-protein kinase [Mesomycoplasma lagogenitalium]WGI36541.1 serine/threonine-protein kinase [Mesomycoplasma lagogenitalium]